ncbi:hypothetical protein [Rhizobium leguminosarum]|uniref:hypothetical protein n=1 Tax=Rhizobium leguminosarum TaxID=384 RepID=UPI001C91435F|nr:hypothetical protein [Rhizobium leguminosarum]MBY2984793.1 hypothetical protein [Rhizobium leguminosarum]
MAKRMHAILNVVMKVKRFDLTQGRCAEVDAAAHMKAFATNAMGSRPSRDRDHGQAAIEITAKPPIPVSSSI